MSRKAKRKYSRRGRPRKAELAASGQVTLGADTEQPSQALTITQRLHNAEQERDALKIEVHEIAKAESERRQETYRLNQQQINSLQNEVGMLRAMLSRLTYGGVHVRDIDSVGIGAR